MNFNIKSKKGFTLIELLVVIGILAVLAAIAIPSVAGLIDRANVSSDKANSNEMTNAVERFASEYELYCQDIASGTLDPSNFDSTQGRVYNVTQITDRAGIERIEKDSSADANTEGRAIYRDTKYPVNVETMQAIVENYTKTSSSTFEPKQSDMHYWYSPDCGVVVFAEPNADQDKENKLNSQIQSGQDAKGNDLGPTTQWIDLTLGVASGGDSFDWSSVNTDLSTNTWEDVQKISQAGKVTQAGWAIGDTKTLTAQGRDATAILIGIDHDCVGTTTWMLLYSLGERYMNSSHTCSGGWKSSSMRESLNTYCYNDLSNKEYIKEVTKLTNNIGKTGNSVSETSDKLFLLSPIEIGVAWQMADPNEWNDPDYAGMNALNSEGTTYAYFENNIINNNMAFYLRSPVNSTSSQQSFFAYYNGKLYSYRAGIRNQTLAAFAIG